MLVQPPMEQLLPKVDNRYILAVLVAKRARQLVNGAQPLNQSTSPNLVTVACEELGANKVACVRGQVKAYIPLRPEIEAARLAAQAAAEQASTADAIKEELDKVTAVSDNQPLGADDAALIGEALMNLQPLGTENVEKEVYTSEGENHSVADSEADEQLNQYSSTANINADYAGSSSNDDLPFKLAPPVEATQLINNQTIDNSEEEA